MAMCLFLSWRCSFCVTGKSPIVSTLESEAAYAGGTATIVFSS